MRKGLEPVAGDADVAYADEVRERVAVPHGPMVSRSRGSREWAKERNYALRTMSYQPAVTSTGPDFLASMRDRATAPERGVGLVR